jgi:hypothetical protein
LPWLINKPEINNILWLLEYLVSLTLFFND